MRRNDNWTGAPRTDARTRAHPPAACPPESGRGLAKVATTHLLALRPHLCVHPARVSDAYCTCVDKNTTSSCSTTSATNNKTLCVRAAMAADDAALLHAALRQLKLKGEAVLSLPKAESEGALAETVAFLSASLSAHADVTVLRQPSPQDPGQALVLIRNRDELRELRVCVIGNVRAPRFDCLVERRPLLDADTSTPLLAPRWTPARSVSRGVPPLQRGGCGTRRPAP